MKFIYSFCLLFLIHLSKQEKLKISIYYEALCPDSKNFIVRQLYPTYDKLNSLIQLDFVPYGKAIQNKIDGKWQFDCQHGPRECFGNKIQACALHQNFNETTNLKFIDCLMKKRQPDRAGQHCANSTEIPWENINNCSTSDMGDNFLAEYGDRTHAIMSQISFIPSIFIDDIFDPNLQEDILTDFANVVCQKAGYPPVCKK